MKRFLMFTTIIAVLGVLVTAALASAQQEREEVMVLIPMKYMSAATAAQLFGGSVLDSSPYLQSFGSRGTVGGGYGGYDQGYGSGSYQSGPSIGSGYRQFGQSQSGYGQSLPYVR